jgi:hypothetical protein
MKQISNLLYAVFLAATLVSVMGCSTPPRRESSQYLEDSHVTTKVKAAIYNDVQAKDNEIHVDAFIVLRQEFGQSRPWALGQFGPLCACYLSLSLA